MPVDLVRIVGVLVGVVALGCGDDGTVDTDTGPVDSAIDSAPDEGIDTRSPVLEPLTVEVVFEGESLADVPVGLVAPDGSAMEARTDAAGRVTFDDLDWSLGEASVTAYVEGTVSHAFSVAGLTRDIAIARLVDGAFPLVYGIAPPASTVPEYVDFTGTVSNRTMAGGVSVIVGGRSSIGGMFLAAGTADYALDVERGVPFTLFAIEAAGTTPTPSGLSHPSFAWARVDSDGIDAPATLDIDFASPVVPTTVTGSFAVPAGLVPGTRPTAIPVTLVARTEALRAADRVESYGYTSDRSRLEFTHAHLLPAGATAADYRTNFTIIEPDSPVYGSSFVEVDGLPVAGEQAFTLLGVPRIISPSPGADAPRTRPIVFEVSDENVDVRIELFASASTGVQLRWSTLVLSGSSVVIPPLPLSIDEATATGGATLSGGVSVRREDGTTIYGADRGGLQLMP